MGAGLNPARIARCGCLMEKLGPMLVKVTPCNETCERMVGSSVARIGVLSVTLDLGTGQAIGLEYR